MGKEIWCSSASRSKKSSSTWWTTSSMRASARSTLLMTRTTGSRASSALRSTKRVWGKGPSDASTSSSTPSTMFRPRSTSPPKSAWPGVSTTFIFTPPQRTAVFLARMVMPFSRSRSPESRTRSVTSWRAPNASVWRQHGVDQRRLAVVDVGHDGHIPDVFALLHGAYKARRGQAGFMPQPLCRPCGARGWPARPPPRRGCGPRQPRRRRA